MDRFEIAPGLGPQPGLVLRQVHVKAAFSRPSEMLPGISTWHAAFLRPARASGAEDSVARSVEKRLDQLGDDPGSYWWSGWTMTMMSAPEPPSV